MRTLKQPQNQPNGKNRYKTLVETGAWDAQLQAMIAGQKRKRDENKRIAEEKEKLAERVKELEYELQKRQP